MPSRAWPCLVGLLLAAASFAAEPQPPAVAGGPKAPARKAEPAKADAKDKPPAQEMEHLDVWADNGSYEGVHKEEPKKEPPKGADSKKPSPKKEPPKREPPKKDEPAPEPIPGKFHFNGQVTVIRGTLRIDCEKMDGLIDPKTRDVSRVIAVGNVKILTIESVTADAQGKPKSDAVAQDAWHGLCSTADYDVKSDRLEMTALPGKPRPRLWRDKGVGEADKILFFPNKGEYELIGDPVLRGEMPAGPSAPAEKKPAAE